MWWLLLSNGQEVTFVAIKIFIKSVVNINSLHLFTTIWFTVDERFKRDN